MTYLEMTVTSSGLRMYHLECDTSALSDLSANRTELASPPQSYQVECVSTQSPARSVNGTEPACSTPFSGNNVLPHASFLCRLLADKVPTITYPSKPQSRNGSRVLTSAENMAHMDEKERKGRRKQRKS